MMVAAVPAATVATTFRMANCTAVARGAHVYGGRMVETFLMAAEVVMLFPRMMDFKRGRIAAPTPGVRRISTNWIVGVAVIVPGAAVASTIEAAADSACANDHKGQRWN